MRVTADIATPLPAGLPPGTTLERIALPAGETLDLLIVPLDEPGPADRPSAAAELASLAERTRAWVAPPSAAALVIPLSGAHVTWSVGRAAVIGPPPRLAALQAEVGEFAAAECRLRRIEAGLAALAPHVEEDAGLAFEFTACELPRCAELQARFRQAVALRLRLAALAPDLQRPATHPSMPAGELGTRIRERSWTAERAEFAAARAEIVAGVYEGCGQRVVDFSIDRRQFVREWAIVVLLVVQTLLLAVAVLASRRP